MLAFELVETSAYREQSWPLFARNLQLSSLSLRHNLKTEIPEQYNGKIDFWPSDSLPLKLLVSEKLN